MNISEISTKELKQEIERRSDLEESRPQLKEDIDWSTVISYAEDTVGQVISGNYHEDRDDVQYMWEEVMTTVYGEDFFEWFNKHAY